MASPNPNALTYNLYVQQVCTLAVVLSSSVAGVTTPTDVAMQALVPSMLNYAELRIQRDLDLLNSLYVNITYSMTIGINNLSISANDFQTIQTISYDLGTSRIPILATSNEFIQNGYSDMSVLSRGPPLFYSFQGGDQGTGGTTGNNIYFGPRPDLNYNLTITGTQNLPSLYATQSTNGLGTTYISTNYPEMLVCASMIYISLYQRNFGAASNDPQMGFTYEQQYGVLLKSAIELENRKKFRDAAWSSQSQSPVATPVR